MPSPFPGMDPYLEDRTIFPGFHSHLAEEIVGQLNAVIGPKYFAEVEVQTVFEDADTFKSFAIIPDVTIAREAQAVYVATSSDVAITPPPMRRTLVPTKLRTVQIHLTKSKELITVIEILSPYNKRGEGLDEYRHKRSRLLNSKVHLVELDLLRGGTRPGRELDDLPRDADYVCVVNCYRGANSGRDSDIWTIALNAPLPVLPIPLRAPDADVRFSLRAAINAVYARAGYAWRINYAESVPPPELRAAMRA